MEASIIERLNQLRQWQIEQQERLLKQQQEQRDTLTYQQDCMFRALELSVQNITRDNSIVNADVLSESNNSDVNTSLPTSPKVQSLTVNPNDVLQIQKSLEAINLSCNSIDESKNSKMSLNFEEHSSNCFCMKCRFCNTEPADEECREEGLKENCTNFNFAPDNKVPVTEFLMEGVTPLPLDKPTKKLTIIDDIPVPSPKKDFQSLLEEKLKDFEYTSKENTDVHSKGNAKKPFLRKGQGLARFRLNKPSVETAEVTRPRSCSLSSNMRLNTVTHNENKKDPIPKNNSAKKNASIPNVKQRLNLKNVPAPKKKVRSKSVPALPALRQVMNGADLSSSDLESKTQRELEEVRMFELLEEKAENSSFCSTSSTVLAFLQQSSPFKTKRMFGQVTNGITDFKYKNDQRPKRIEQPLSRVDENFARPMDKNTLKNVQSAQTSKHPPNRVVDAYWESVTHTQENRLVSLKGNSSGSYDNPKDIENDVYDVETRTITRNSVERLSDNRPYELNNPTDDNEADISLHVRFSEYNEYKTIGLTDTSSMSSESSRSYADERAWSDCSPIPSTYDEQILAEKFGTKEKPRFLLTDEEQDTQETKLIHRKMNDEWTNGERENADESEVLHSTYTDESSDEEKSQDRKLEFDKDDTLLNEENEEENITCQRNRPNKVNISTNTQPTISARAQEADELGFKNTDGTIFKSELLKTRLLELEEEIDIFRKENAALSIQRKKLQEERESLYKELKEKHDEFEKTRIRTEERLNEEKKKLARDKAAFEIRIRDAQEKNQLYKLERQDAQKLKQELQELKEEMREKESRWNAAHSRQKSQLRILKVENTKLKTELERLENAKKSNLQRRKSSNYSNTKAINRINKQLDGYTKAPVKDPASEEDEDKQVKSMMEALRYQTDEHNSHPEITRNDSGKPNENLQQTVDRVVRKRNLYEHLLKEAVTGLLETEEAPKSTDTLNRQRNLSTERPNESQTLNSSNTEKNKPERLLQENNSPAPILRERHSHSPKVSNAASQETSIKANKENMKVIHHPDGRIEHWYPNGNVKKIFPEQGVTKMLYYNGDVCETEKNGNVKYFYASTRTWHTTMPDGLEILEFPDGQVERRSKNGNIEISFPDGSLRMLQSDGSEKWVLPDGTIAETFSNGEKVLNLPNGQREVHTQQHKRREYPDGTVKLVYPDGTQETRYSNGRVRLKDKDGNLLMDSQLNT